MKIKMEGLRQAQRDIKSWTDRQEKAVGDEVAKGALNIERSAKNNVPSDEGILRASITQETRGLEREVFSSSMYAPYVEFGTKKKVSVPAGLEGYAQQFRGERGTFGDLVSNIEGWVRRKGIDEEAIYPIAISIAVNGVSARPFLFPAAEQERERYRKAIEEIFK